MNLAPMKKKKKKKKTHKRNKQKKNNTQKNLTPAWKRSVYYVYYSKGL